MLSKPFLPRILFILHLPPPVHGAAMMGQFIHESKVINDTFECQYINLTLAASLLDIGHGGLSKLWRYLRLLWRVRQEVKSFKPNLVYVTPSAQGGAFYKDFVLVEMLKSMGCHVVAHYHNKGVSIRQDYWFDDKLYRHFYKDLSVILLAESLFNDVEKYVERKDVFICPNGIKESRALTQSSTVKCGEQNKEPHILFLSNLIESKGIFVLLDACKLLKDEGDCFILDIVGGETEEIDTARLTKELQDRGLNEIVSYAGRLTGDEKSRVLKQVSLLTLPTENDCFPLVLLEAMEHALPVVTTPEGGIPDIVENGVTGFIVPQHDAHALAEKIKLLLHNTKLRKDMGEAGRHRFEDYFTMERFERRLCEILARCI